MPGKVTSSFPSDKVIAGYKTVPYLSCPVLKSVVANIKDIVCVVPQNNIGLQIDLKEIRSS